MTETLPAVPRPQDAEAPIEFCPFPQRGIRRPDLDAAFAAFFTEESAALDEGRHQDWLDMLDERFIYQVPVPLLREDPSLPRYSERALLFEATKRVLAMKLGRIGLPHAWSDRPSAAMRHFVGATRVFAATEPGTWRVDSNVLATWTRGRDETAQSTAGRHDVVRWTGSGSFSLLRRRALLDTELPTHEQLSIIF